MARSVIRWTKSCIVIGYLSERDGTMLPTVLQENSVTVSSALFLHYKSFIDKACFDQRWLDIGFTPFSSMSMDLNNNN